MYMILYNEFKQTSDNYRLSLTNSLLANNYARSINTTIKQQELSNYSIINLYVLKSIEQANKTTLPGKKLIIPGWTNEYTINQLLSNLKDLS